MQSHIGAARMPREMPGTVSQSSPKGDVELSLGPNALKIGRFRCSLRATPPMTLLVELDAGVEDDLRKLRGFGPDEFPELPGRGGRGLEADGAQL